MRTWSTDSIARTRWILLTLATPFLILVFVLADDYTVRFTAGFAYTAGLAIIVISERILVSTRSRPETRLANARQGSIKH